MANIETKALGNIIAPDNSSIIFGKTANSTNTDIEISLADTYKSYNIVCIEEDEEEDDIINAADVSFTSSGSLTSANVQDAINEVELLIYNNMPTFTMETITATAGATSFTVSTIFDTASSMVFYNGLLINKDIHYTFVNKTITLNGFSAEADDIITIVGLASQGSGVNNINVQALIKRDY